ncbi:tyrosyl-tRNA synthetase [Buchnera aphidicola str. Bp (Baizongia pistaciae)]|uniref:Tyrosine--tRNA ligase n=1 Tax=Buchnera aphidicola subsp. Baizongia pistaciae (strain Bp) TaxID=224915 RepID=SYY_BUCBP|nr:tyrosine--tRNA ligase [Buchnera aphidicola]Q89AW3.1 RecName: Full=Tyrosine--tRNA ligase; AltName: Full=Tyrosyl-tRNA synthetase; Short=TyrRS [Buchnera aphidicola str. Bp (Baizongia pistaciae)]AAO26849.1 tyrosyl-tRNA synthetase [Buchnera aphidicola str. Bp (Baizongia pistaciae)]
MLTDTLIQEFQDRNLISQITNEIDLKNILLHNKISLYCGFDITADSLHVGHILPLLCLRRFQNLGHRPVILMGGGTSLIGDPSFKLLERQLNSIELVHTWKQKITKQLSLFLKFNVGKNNALIVDNYEWFKNINVLTFLRDIGKHFSINQMIVRDAIQRRIKRLDQGISFTEFSYNLLQAYDFYFLNKQLDVILQIGGSDQWGNIISGIDLIRRLHKKRAYGITVPLLTKKDGRKFGKTELDTIWLDKMKTSPYKFYQYWMNISDSDIYSFLKMFTFLSLSEIKALKDTTKPTELNSVKKILAEYLTNLVHGSNEVRAIQRITSSLFSGKFSEMKETDFFQLEQDGMPSVQLYNSGNLQQLLVYSRLALSRSHAKSMIVSNSVRINNIIQNNPFYILCNRDKMYHKYTLLSRGKKNFCLLCWTK